MGHHASSQRPGQVIFGGVDPAAPGAVLAQLQRAICPLCDADVRDDCGLMDCADSGTSSQCAGSCCGLAPNPTNAPNDLGANHVISIAVADAGPDRSPNSKPKHHGTDNVDACSWADIDTDCAADELDAYRGPDCDAIHPSTVHVAVSVTNLPGTLTGADPCPEPRANNGVANLESDPSAQHGRSVAVADAAVHPSTGLPTGPERPNLRLAR